MRINPKFATESEFYHICVPPEVLQCACAPFSFRHLIKFLNNHVRLLSADAGKTIDRVLRTHLFTDSNQSHFCCKYWLHSLDITDPV